MDVSSDRKRPAGLILLNLEELPLRDHEHMPMKVELNPEEDDPHMLLLKYRE
jgi:hypothetical protein